MLLQILLRPTNGPASASWQGVVLAVESDQPEGGCSGNRCWPSTAGKIEDPLSVRKTCSPIGHGFAMTAEQFTDRVDGDLVL